MTDRLHHEDDVEVIRRSGFDAGWDALLRPVVWGTDGLRYRLRDPAHALHRWEGAEFLELRRAGELLAVFVLVRHDYVVADTPITAWYRSMLAVKDGLAGAGLGRVITAAARRVYLDAATGPTLLYGYIEAANARSLRLQERLGYAPLFDLQAASWGWLRPARAPGVGRVSDRAAFVAAARRFWAGHALDDLDASVRADEIWGLERGGRLVAGAQIVPKPLEIVGLPGLDGKALIAGSPLLRHLTPFFRTNPHDVAWTGAAFWEDDPADLATLLQGVQAETGASSGLWYLDPRSPRAGRAPLGPVATLSPATTLRAMAGWRHVSDALVDVIRAGPIVASALDSA